MIPLKWAKRNYLQWVANRAKQQLLAQKNIDDIDPEDFSSSLRNPDSYYRRAFQDFHRVLPGELQAHRGYFGIDQRGFGEDAFHVMWWRLFRRFRPESFLEIGVYRGQILSLIALLSKLEGDYCDVTGISPFSPVGDSVSDYQEDLNYLDDTLSHFNYYGLPKPTLINAFSTDADALGVIAGRQWDMIYIDGNHDYDVVVKDWEVCSTAVKPGGIIVLDDSSLTTAYRPPPFSTAGHPGPSRLASEIDPDHFRRILQVGHNQVFEKLS